jgi:hypothetical protein
MLFDLRGGRQATVRIVYVGLALLLVGGLLLGVVAAVFGLGTGSDAQTSAFETRIDSAQQTLRSNPTDSAALLELTRSRFLQAQQIGYDSTTQQFTPEGVTQLRGADDAWQRYLKTVPARPDTSVARLMSQVYSPTSLNSPTRALQAWQLVVDNTAEPTAGDFVQLAQLGYAANRTRVADLASDRALELTPKAQRKALKTSLDGYKAQAAGAAASATGGAAAPTVTTG